MQTKAQERKSIAQQLAVDPEQSNRVIAATLGVNDKLVATVRAKLERSGGIPVVDHIRCADGRLRPRAGARDGTPAEPKPAIENGRTSNGAASPLALTAARNAPRNRAPSSNNASVLGQLRTACRSHPLAFAVALPFGGVVPVAVWCLAHLEPLHWWTWTMIAGGALFSSLTVINWGERILANVVKAVGFAVLVEGVMLTATQKWLSLTALGLLIVINATSCAVALARDEASACSA